MNDYYSTILDCGLEVIAQPLPGVQSAAFGFFVGAGARDENWDVAGLAHLAEATMFRGTEHRSARELTDELDRLGVSRSSNTGVDMTLFSGVMIGDFVQNALTVFIDVLRHPAFPAEDLEAVRGLQLQEIGQREDQPAQLVMDRARQLFFAGSPLGNDVLGTHESVSGLTRDQVVTYWKTKYSPANILLAAAGKLDWQELLDTLESLCKDWHPDEARTSGLEPAINPAIRVQETETAQENICFTFPGVAYGHALYYPAALVSLALGGGMNSRLNTEVREKRALVYSVGCRFDGMEKTGLYRIYAGTQPDRARETVEVVNAELDKLQNGGLEATELELAKTRLKSRTVIASESTGNRAMTVGRDWWYQHRFRRLDQIRDQIDAVTLEDVIELLERIRITENLGMLAIGPLSAHDLGVEDRAFETVEAKA